MLKISGPGLVTSEVEPGRLFRRLLLPHAFFGRFMSGDESFSISHHASRTWCNGFGPGICLCSRCEMIAAAQSPSRQSRGALRIGEGSPESAAIHCEPNYSQSPCAESFNSMASSLRIAQKCNTLQKVRPARRTLNPDDWSWQVKRVTHVA